MKNIVPHLWFDKEAREAADLYISLFKNSEIKNTTIIRDTPSGDVEIVEFVLEGQPFMSISGGPYFNFNPSVSLMVSCYSKEEIDKIWSVFSEGGNVLMPLQSYPFSPYYGWIQDLYGLSWQLILVEEEPSPFKIVPNLLFSEEVCGRAEEAANFYVDIFKYSAIHFISRYTKGEAQCPKAIVNYLSFELEKMPVIAMDNGYEVDYKFNEAFSLILNCESQEEIDYYWEKLSAVPEAEQCGWIKDQFGFSWQIVPYNMAELMLADSDEATENVNRAMLSMKKIDIEALKMAKS